MEGAEEVQSEGKGHHTGRTVVVTWKHVGAKPRSDCWKILWDVQLRIQTVWCPAGSVWLFTTPHLQVYVFRTRDSLIPLDTQLSTNLNFSANNYISALSEYRGPGSDDLVAPAIGKIVTSALKKEGAAQSLIIAALEVSSLSRNIVRQLLSDCPPEVVWLPAAWLSSELNKRSTAMLALRG